jgi:tetratricopeptide (TPR) repeat protein
MKKEQFNREFLPKEIVLKLLREIPPTNCEQKIKLIKNYTQTIKESFDSDVFEVRFNNEIGLCYWEAKEYALAESHFRKVNILKPQHYPFLYFLVVGLLIRCNRLISNYVESFYWVDIAVSNIIFADSSFDKLNILKEYVDLLTDTKQAFNHNYNKIIIEIINDLGFPEGLTNPIDTVNSMRNTNLTWNRKLSEIGLTDKKDINSLIKLYESYKEKCPVEWYKKYAEEAIIRIKNGR